MQNKKKEELKFILMISCIILIMLLYFSHKVCYMELGEKEQQITIMLTVILSFFLIAVVGFYIKNKKNVKVERIYLLLAIISCSLYMIVMPMSKAHDETIHGYRIYEYVEGKFFSDGQTVELEEGVINALADKAKYKNLWEKDASFYDVRTQKTSVNSRVATYSPISYFPQIIGVMVGRVVTPNALVHVYIARIFNSIACIAMLYLAIKIIPFGKNMLLLIALIPITIEGCSSLSADGIAISSCMLWIAYILHLSYKEQKIGTKQILCLLGLAVLVGISKTIYLLMVLFILFIPKEKFQNRKVKWLASIGIFLIAAIIDLVWFKIGISSAVDLVSTQNTPMQYIVGHPIGYLQKIGYTIFTRFPNYMLELFGGFLEWNENVKIDFMPYVLLGVLIFVITSGKKQIVLKKVWEKVLVLGIGISTIILIYTSMFVGWTDLAVDYIQGIQGRYFLPILPLLLLFASRWNDEEETTKNISICLAIVQVFAVINILIFHL